jgi:integrin alpha FG-GAP repeat containing protein 1
MSNDGKLDLIVVSESDETPLSINVIYNTFKSDPETPCTLINQSLSNPYDKTAFSAVATNAGINQIFTLPTSYPVGTKLFTKDLINRPGRVRVGDINIDGYPDLLFVVKTPTPEGETKDESYGTIVLVMNQENNLIFNVPSTNTGLKSENYLYYNAMKDENSQDTNNINLLTVPATSASFFDFHEKGKLGLWINTKTKDTNTALLGAFNFVTSENFILKALGLNGAAPSSKEKINEVLGGLYYGATIECTVTKVDGKNTLSKVAQLPQSAYTSLEIPYMFMGLGRTNNYIEKFYMGISKKDDDKSGKGQQQQNWITIIPNSQLIVNPKIGTTWTLDIYVNPTSEAFLISLVTGIILLILGIVIIYLHRQEKAEDIANQDRMIHIFG